MRRITTLVAIFVLFCLALPAFASAATFETNTTTDAVDANPGDGICLTAASQCSLRAAIQEAMASPGADTVQLPSSGFFALSAGAPGDSSSASGDFDISSAGGVLTVQGPSSISPASRPIIDAGDIDRIFDLTAAASLNLFDVTLKNGSVDSSGPARGGGGLIQSFGGTLDIRRASLKDGLAQGDWGSGGAIYMNGNSGGRLSISDSLVQNNTSGKLAPQSSSGGALTLDAVNSGGTGVTIKRSTFLNNLANHTSGGAIDNEFSTIRVENSTFTGNMDNNNGGAVLLQGSGTTDFFYSTLVDNIGNLDSGVRALGGTVSFTGSILESSGNPAFQPVCLSAGGTISSGGYNLANMANNGAAHSGSKDCNITATGDAPGASIDLGVLADNGGFVSTFSPSPGSLALDGGPASCSSISDDARGGFRPFGTRCDVGAVEVGGLINASVDSVDTSLAPGKVGDTGTVRFTVANAGPDDAANLSTPLSWSAGLELLSASASAGGSCTVVSCSFASMPAFSGATVDVQVKAVSPGSQTISLSTTPSLQNDFSSANDSRQANLSIAELPSSGGGGGSGGGGSGGGDGDNSSPPAQLSGLKLLKNKVSASKGFTLSFALSKASSLSLAVSRRSGKSYKPVASLSKPFPAGASKWRVTKLSGKKLRKGSYRLNLKPQGGSASKALLLKVK